MKKIICLFSLFYCCFSISAQAQTAWEFNGTTAPTGWTIINYQTSSNFASGCWNLITPATAQTAYIGYMVAPANSQVNTETFKFLKINIKNETAQTSARFYFWYSGSPVFIPFALQANSGYTEYTIDLHNSDAFSGPTSVNIGKKWKYNAADAGTYKNMPFIRFDMPSVVPPASGAGVLAGSTNKLISVDYVRFSTSTTPVVTLTAATSVTSSSAEFSAQVSNDGGSTVTDRGLVWTTSPVWTTSNKIRQGAGLGTFLQTLNALAPGTTYYVKSYASNNAGTAYSGEQSFTTTIADTTSNLSNLTLSGGIVLGETFNPNKINYKQAVASSVTSVTVTPVVANPNATVKVNNVAVTSNTASGSIALAAGPNIIEVKVTNAVSVTTKTYLLTLNVDAQYGWEFTASTIPTGWSQTNFQSSTFADGSWNLVTPATPMSAFIRYQTTAAASSIITTTYKYVKIRLKNGTAQTTGRFYFPYGSTNVFIPFNIQPYSDYIDYIIDLAGSDAFSGNQGSLVNVGKKWTYDAADALTLPKMTSIRFDVPSTTPPTSGAGVQYGSLSLPVSVDDIRFLSISGPAGVVTAVPTAITNAPSVVLEGQVTADGGAVVTERGIVWGERVNPTVTDNKLEMGAGTGTFLQTFTGFNKGTLYYARAYAINANGTIYGNTVSFISKTIPLELTTAVPQSLTDSCFQIGGTIGKDGGAMVTDRGIVWAETPTPTLSSNKIEMCSGVGSFSKVNVFVPGKTYYLRTYALNSEGITYGEEQVITIAGPDSLLRAVMFSGKAQKYANRLEWKTTGIDVVEFTIERKTDGNSYIPLGWVRPNGSKTSYEFQDPMSAKRNPVLQYKLKVKDKKGKIFESDIVTIRSAAEALAMIYPNPVVSTATIKISNEKFLNTKAEIVNLYGERYQVILLNALETPFDMSSQRPGIYFMKFVDGSSIELLKQ